MVAGAPRLFERVFDLVVGTELLAIAAPVIALIGLLIRVDSPGSAIFAQKRYGENGRLFATYRFRRYRPWQRKRFAVPRGLTGRWQISERSDKPMPPNTHVDLYYVLQLLNVARHPNLVADLASGAEGKWRHLIWNPVPLKTTS